MLTRHSFTLTIGFVAAFASRTFAVSYTAQILYPFDVEATGASNIYQVGWDYDGNARATLWKGSPESKVNLHPSGYFATVVTDTSDINQVGWGNHPNNYGLHALLWAGTAESVVDLHPVGLDTSQAFGTNGEYQVGTGSGKATENKDHALLWRGTAESAVDLHPAGYDRSTADDVYQHQQIGTASIKRILDVEHHAVLWSGTPESAVDLHPIGFDLSYGNALTEGVQVGTGSGNATGGELHALMWRGTSSSMIDLHPQGFIHSQATDAYGDYQVGQGWTGLNSRALLWNGSAGSVVNLHQFLADLPREIFSSRAAAIAPNGTIVGTGFDIYGYDNIILWTPTVPEPHSLLSLISAIPLLASVRLLQCRFRRIPLA